MSLKMYRKKASSAQFWEEHWERFLRENSLKKFYQSFSDDSVIMKVFEKYLPRDGKIIEAGCGLGQYIYFLRKRNYDIEGIDFAKETVNFVNSEFPQLPVHVGQLFHLDYPDGALKGYISLGVVEHFEEGPQRILKEAYRVLDKGGILILSVPYFNPLRRIKKCFGFHKSVGEFYQYAFTKGEIEDSLIRTGFKVLNYCYYDVYKGLKDELSFITPLLRLLKKRLKSTISESKREVNFTKSKTSTVFSLIKKLSQNIVLGSLSSHMIIYTAVKVKQYK